MKRRDYGHEINRGERAERERREIGHVGRQETDRAGSVDDEARRRALFDEILGLNLQAFMTGTDPVLFASLGARAQTFRIARGAVLQTA